MGVSCIVIFARLRLRFMAFSFASAVEYATAPLTLVMWLGLHFSTSGTPSRKVGIGVVT